LEAFVDFEKEVSVVCARGYDGDFAHYGVIENSHRSHILDVSFAPADVSTGVQGDAVQIARDLAESLGYVGTLCVELFLTPDEQLLVNEIAPRPHNSGHLTFDACITSQFEQQLRAVHHTMRHIEKLRGVKHRRGPALSDGERGDVSRGRVAPASIPANNETPR